MKNVFLGKRTLVVLFLIFLSSCSAPCPHWVREEICSPCPQYSSSRIFLANQDLFSQIELEFVRDHTGERLYVNVLAVAELEDDDHPGMTSVTVDIDGGETTVLAARFQGGQRFLLPDATRQMVAAAFRGGRCVTVMIGHHRRTFPPTGF